jgi:hypothetical protein
MALRATTKTKAPAAAETPTTTAGISVCIDGHSSPFGVFARGARLRSDHEAVQFAPKLWIEDGASDAEISMKRNKMYDDVVFDSAHAKAAAEAQAREQQTPMARATRSFSVPMVDVKALDNSLPAWGIFAVQEGMDFPRQSAIVRLRPDWFRPV